MPITVSWDNEEHTILRIDFSGEWNADKFQDATKEAHKLITEQTDQVCLISVFSHHTLLPKGLLNKLYRTQISHPQNQTIHVVVGNSPMIRSLFSVLQRITERSSTNIHIANSIDDARKICQRRQHANQIPLNFPE